MKFDFEKRVKNKVSCVEYVSNNCQKVLSGKFVPMLKENWNAENFNLINVY